MEGKTEWINKELLALALSNNSKHDGVMIKDLSIRPAVEHGDNYCTTLLKVRVNYQRGNQHLSKGLIIKAPLDTSSVAKSIVDDGEFLEKETIMYNKILPQINTISKKQFCPKNYFCKIENVLIMEDLTDEGFKMGDRLQQLDLAHCKQFLTTLAEYHAASVALYRKNPELIESNGVHPLFNERMNNKVLFYFENIKFKTFVKIVKKLNGLEAFAEKIESFGDGLRTAVINQLKQRGKFNVLNHGDCWTNNIMYKYSDDGGISECKLIDFPIRSFSSPLNDLLYFLFTSVRTEVRGNHTDELLQLYCDTLNKTLQQLKCEERLSLQDLQEEMRKAAPTAVYTVSNCLPIFLAEPDEVLNELRKNPENFKSPDINVNPVLRHFLSKTYNSVLRGVCNDMIKMGII